jgi:hypothetical protein
MLELIVQFRRFLRECRLDFLKVVLKFGFQFPNLFLNTGNVRQLQLIRDDLAFCGQRVALLPLITIIRFVRHQSKVFRVFESVPYRC